MVEVLVDLRTRKFNGGDRARGELPAEYLGRRQDVFARVEDLRVARADFLARLFGRDLEDFGARNGHAINCEGGSRGSGVIRVGHMKEQ